MKLSCLFLTLFLISCDDAPEQKQQATTEVKTPVNKSEKSHSVMKGHQDVIQRAKDAEKQILKAAEEQKKAIDDLDG